MADNDSQAASGTIPPAPPSAPVPPAPPAPPSSEGQVAAASVPPETGVQEEAEAPKKVTKKKGRPRKKKIETKERVQEFARVTVTTPYKLHIHTQDIMIIPGSNPRVMLDSFVRHQLEAGVLKIVEE